MYTPRVINLVSHTSMVGGRFDLFAMFIMLFICLNWSFVLSGGRAFFGFCSFLVADVLETSAEVVADACPVFNDRLQHFCRVNTDQLLRDPSTASMCPIIYHRQRICLWPQLGGVKPHRGIDPYCKQHTDAIMKKSIPRGV
jgi:hypothetical protein